MGFCKNDFFYKVIQLSSEVRSVTYMKHLKAFKDISVKCNASMFLFIYRLTTVGKLAKSTSL